MRKCLWMALLLISFWSVGVTAEEAQQQQDDPVFLSLFWRDPLKYLGEVEEATSDEAKGLIEVFYGIYSEGERKVKLTERDFPDLVFKIYKRVTDIRSLGTVPVDEVLYGFVNGELAMVHITNSEYERLKEIVEKRYGTLGYERDWYFDGSNKMIGQTFIGLTVIRSKYQALSDHGIFELHSVAIFDYAKVVLTQRKLEKEEAYKRRVEADSKSW